MLLKDIKKINLKNLNVKKKKEKVLVLIADSGQRVGYYKQQPGDMVYPRYQETALY